MRVRAPVQRIGVAADVRAGDGDRADRDVLTRFAATDAIRNRPCFDLQIGCRDADRASLAGDEAKVRAGGTGRLAMNVGNAYFGYGDYAKAAEIYRLAGQRSDVDASLANLRLGEALAMAGDKAGAAAAFKAVNGPRAELASLWSTWLAMKR